jgi:hypothetical protein
VRTRTWAGCCGNDGAIVHHVPPPITRELGHTIDDISFLRRKYLSVSSCHDKKRINAASPIKGYRNRKRETNITGKSHEENAHDMNALKWHCRFSMWRSSMWRYEQAAWVRRRCSAAVWPVRANPVRSETLPTRKEGTSRMADRTFRPLWHLTMVERVIQGATGSVVGG